MKLISKLVMLWIAVLAPIWILVLNYEVFGFDKIGKGHGRLTAVAAVGPFTSSPDKAGLSAGERHEIDYPQAVDNSTPLWITPKRLVTHRAVSRGFNRSELKCLFELIDRESSWNHKAANPNSSAYGLFQQLKLDPDSSVQKQVRLGLTYIEHRYGTPCAALSHHNRKGWY